MNPKDYPVEVRPLAADDGGGWLATFPDLPGCMGDIHQKRLFPMATRRHKPG